MHNNDKKLILRFNSKLFEINLRNTETAKLISSSKLREINASFGNTATVDTYYETDDENPR